MRGPQARWLERIMEFILFNLEHRPGKLHSNADGLSRYPWDKCQTQIMVKESPVYTVSDNQTDADFMNNWTLGPLSGWSHEEVSKSQNSDKVISQVLGWVRSGKRPPADRMHGSGMELWSYCHQFERFVIKMNCYIEYGGRKENMKFHTINWFYPFW